MFFFFFIYFIIGGTFESFDLLIVLFTCLVVVPLILVGLHVDSSVNLVMSLVSHDSLYIFILSIFLLKIVCKYGCYTCALHD